MNCYEKQGVLQAAIEDAERRLGSYLAHEGCEKTDKYAQHQISLIRDWAKQLSTLYGLPAIEEPPAQVSLQEINFMAARIGNGESKIISKDAIPYIDASYLAVAVSSCIKVNRISVEPISALTTETQGHVVVAYLDGIYDWPKNDFFELCGSKFYLAERSK